MSQLNAAVSLQMSILEKADFLIAHDEDFEFRQNIVMEVPLCDVIERHVCQKID